MKRRFIVTGFLCCLTAALASAQTLTASETDINQAFANLRGVDKVLFRLQGNVYYGSTTTPIVSDLFWDRPLASTSQDMKIELLEAQNGIVNHRVVADGQHLWDVDLVKNTYSASRYGSYTGTPPTDYEQNGLQSFNLLANGQSALLARLLREVWGGTTSGYRPWIPASTTRSEQTTTGAGTTFNDPVVTTRVYAATATTSYYTYWTTKGGAPVRSLTFELQYNDSTTSWDLAAIYFSDLTTVGKIQRLTDWKTDVYTGILPSTGNFAFTPAPGARAIASPRPNGSG